MASSENNTSHLTEDTSTVCENEEICHGSDEVMTASDQVNQDQDSSMKHSAPQMSKNQLKKLKRKEKWLEFKHEKRKRVKKNLKEKKKRMKEAGEDTGPTRQQLKHNKMANSACKVQVAVDCSFDDYMSEKFYVTGVEKQLKDRLAHIGDYVNWDMNFQQEDYQDIFEKEDIVYLSSESPNLLDTLSDGKVYIIGGLVDHNHHKGLCHKIAEERGLAHAQLPIGDYLEMNSRKVLTINHVFEILLHYTEKKSWEEACFAVIPKRKGAMLKNTLPVEEANKRNNDPTAAAPNCCDESGKDNLPVCSKTEEDTQPHTDTAQTIAFEQPVTS